MTWLPQGNHLSQGKHQRQEKIDTIFVRLLLRPCKFITAFARPSTGKFCLQNAARLAWLPESNYIPQQHVSFSHLQGEHQGVETQFEIHAPFLSP
jgi:hypothetical protein